MVLNIDVNIYVNVPDDGRCEFSLILLSWIARRCPLKRRVTWGNRRRTRRTLDTRRTAPTAAAHFAYGPYTVPGDG